MGSSTGGHAETGEESSGEETGAEEPDAGTDGDATPNTCLDLPLVMQEILAGASAEAIEVAVAQAQPGDRIRIPGGTYRDVTFDVSGGSLDAAPIEIVPDDPARPPTFQGRNWAMGENFAIMGMRFDAQHTGSGGRMLRVQDAHSVMLAYLEFEKTDNIAIEFSGEVFSSTIHGVRIHGTGTSSMSTGAAAIKAGVSTVAGEQRHNRIQYSRIEDVVDGRETISGKEGGLTVFRVTFSNTNDVVARHATAMVVEECVGMRRITLNGPDHLVLNSRAENGIEIWSGSHDGSEPYSEIPNGNASVYLSGHDVRVEHSSGELRVGADSYAGGNFVANGVAVADHESGIELFNGASVDEVAAVHPRVDPPTLEASDVGIAAFAACANGARS